MSDSDDESAFESADEGEERLQKERLPADSQAQQATYCKEDVGVERLTEAVQDCETSVCDSKVATAAESGSDLQQETCTTTLPVATGPQLDEGLGDWDTGWEVDEDVLTSGEPCAAADNVKSDDLLETRQKLESVRVGAAGSTKFTPANGQQESKKLVEKMSDAFESKEAQKSSWGWGGWGASLLSTASSSVSTFTSHVGQGLNSVLETVEASLGVPPPEELATRVVADELSEPAKADECPDSENSSANKQKTFVSSSLYVGNIVSGVSSLTSVLEQTGSKVMSGGLDTLELIGRKTMDMLQEGDPGLKRKRSLLNSDRPNLSQVLIEAKERDKELQQSENSVEDSDNKVYFSSIFEECQGLIHLEALEMLSRQSEQKVQIALMSRSGDELVELQHNLEKIKDSFEVKDSEDVDEDYDHDFADIILGLVKNLNVSVSTEKLIKVQSDARNWLRDVSGKNVERERGFQNEIHNKAVSFMAEFTAKVVELIHKMCELILVSNDIEVFEAMKHLSSIANVICVELTIMSSKYTTCLNAAAKDSKDPNAVSPLITSVFLEAANSNMYIQDACQLGIPVLQLKYVQT